MQANWNASLEPEAVGDNRLRSADFEYPSAAHIDTPSRLDENHLRSTNHKERTSEMGNPLRWALDGYCPVQLKENDRWVIGNRDLQVVYQGQLFHFASDIARKQFEAAPEKYAPVRSGNDVVLAIEENRTVPGNVNHSAVWHGRLYLFSNSATLSMFQADPARYASRPRETSLRVPADSL